ncbi:MAG: PRD domain-containing protein [Candidatus Phlomobacter fragariae]
MKNSLSHFDIRLTNEGYQYLIFNCANTILPITRRRKLTTFINNEMEPVIQNAAKEIFNGLIYFLGCDLSKAEQAYLCTQLAVQRIIGNEQPNQKTGLHTKLLDHILQYINDSYNYDLPNDEKLKRDLIIHLTTLLTRLQFNMNTPNPLLADIKKYYPFAYDITFDTLRSASILSLIQLVKTSLVI